MADLFKPQDQVVGRLARSLDLALTSAEAEKGVRSNNPDAIDLTMQGWALFWRDFPKPPNERRESVKQARALFNRALAINPNDADALAGSALTYYEEDFNGWTDPKTDYEAKILGWAGLIERLHLTPTMPGPTSQRPCISVIFPADTPKPLASPTPDSPLTPISSC